MNTISSVYYGWAFLIVCGGGSYYFAKRSINADRAERAALDAQRRAKYQRSLDQQYKRLQPGGQDRHASPSTEAGASVDPAPGSGHKLAGRSRYEASEPYISPKGDRFSRIGREERDK